MPPSKLSAADRSAAQARMASAILLRADTGLVKEALRVHGEPAVAQCKRILMQSGYILSDGKIAPPAEPLLKAPSHLALKATPATEDWKTGLGATWESSSCARLRTLMTAVDSVGLSEHNLKAMGRKHAKEPPKGALLLHFEYMFVLDVTARVPDMIDEPSLVDYLKQRYITYGSRGLRQPLPIDFNGGGGVYTLGFENGNWHLTHSITKQFVELVMIDDPVRIKELYVENNHSDQRAMLKSKRDRGVHELCISLLGSRSGSDSTSTCAHPDDFATPPAKRIRGGPLGRAALLAGSPPASRALPPPAAPVALLDGRIGGADSPTPSALRSPSASPALALSPASLAPASEAPASEAGVDEATFVPVIS